LSREEKSNLHGEKWNRKWGEPVSGSSSFLYFVNRLLIEDNILLTSVKNFKPNSCAVPEGGDAVQRACSRRYVPFRIAEPN